MTTQRLTGLLFSCFLLIVVAAHFAYNYTSFYDVLYVIGAFGFGLSCTRENTAFKILQIVCMAFLGSYISIVDDNSKYIGILILSFAYMMMYTYGFFEKEKVHKNVFWFTCVFFSFCLSCHFNIIEAGKWVFLCFTVNIAFFIVIRDLVKKARRSDELEKVLLKSYLEDSIEAGLILSNELTKGPSHGCQG